MTKDADFKRLVRSRMQDTGEAYARAREALLDEQTDSEMWAVVFAYPYCEEDVRQLLSEGSSKLSEVLFPRYESRKVFRAALLLHLSEAEPSLTAAPWIRAYLGDAESLQLLRWSEVRQRLSVLARRRWPESTVHQPFQATWPEAPIGTEDTGELLAIVAEGHTAARSLRRMRDRRGAAAEAAVRATELGLAARHRLVAQHLYVAHVVARQFERARKADGSPVDADELEEWAVEGLWSMIGSQRASSSEALFQAQAVWWMRRSISAMVVRLPGLRFDSVRW